MPVCASLGVNTFARLDFVLAALLPATEAMDPLDLRGRGPRPCPYGMSGIARPEGGLRLLLNVTAGASNGSTGARFDWGTLPLLEPSWLPLTEEGAAGAEPFDSLC